MAGRNMDPTEKILLDPYIYICQIPGKKVRSQLALAFNHWLQIPSDKLQIIGEATQMLHNASLLIDDIEDSSTLRRGIPVAHNIYGVPHTINSANYVYFLGLQKVLDLQHKDATRVFTEQILELHRGQGMDIYWRDMVSCPSELKPANIFFAFDNSVKLGDFGLAKIMAIDQVGSLDEDRMAKSLTTGVGTYFYMSPEQRGKKYTNKVDIFALGVVLFEMFHSFDSGSERAEMLEAARMLDFPEQFQVKHVQWCDTVRKMLSTEPDDRPTAQELLDRDLLRS